jgi:hypothetical protein
MTVPAYTVYGNRPRLFFRDTEKAALVAKVADPAGWKTIWDATIIPAANYYKARTDLQIVQTGAPHNRIAVLAFAGYLTETGVPAGGYKARAISAAITLAGLSDSVSPTDKRARALTLAIVFDFLYADLTAGQRDTLAAEMIAQCDRMAENPANMMDGYEGNDQMVQAALALTGYGHGAHDWSARLTEALTFYYGADVEAGLWALPRFCNDGGHWKGSNYCYLDAWSEVWMLWILKKATDIDTVTDEADWASKLWEYAIHMTYHEADKDVEAHGDTFKTSSPLFQWEERQFLSVLSTLYPEPNGTEGGKHLRWIYEQKNTVDAAYADSLIFDVIIQDKTIAAVAPKDAAVAPAKVRLFSPPGLLYARSSWDYAVASKIRVECRDWYDLGHRHLSAGSCQIDRRGDRLLLAPAGLYDSYDYKVDGVDVHTHHDSAYQRSWLQSLVPLVFRPAQSYQRYSEAMINDGGQHFKKFGTASDAGNIYDTQSDGGGLAWLRCSYTNPLNPNDAEVAYLTIDLSPAYKKYYTDAADVTIRAKFLVIHPTAGNGLTEDALLWYARIQKTTASWRTMIPLHFGNVFTPTDYGGHATGYRGTGRLWVNVWEKNLLAIAHQQPGTPVDALGYGAQQFVPPTLSTNYPPNQAPNAREWPDLKRDSIYLERSARTTDERYAIFFQIGAAGASRVIPTWATDVSGSVGVYLGTRKYLLGETAETVTYGDQGPDTTPPPEVSGLSLTVGDTELTARWTNPASADLAKVRVYKRTT